MLIVSKRKDYYEIATSVDKTLVWRRYEERVKDFEDKKLAEHLEFNRGEYNRPIVSLFIIGFCGVEYVGLVKNGALYYDDNGLTRALEDYNWSTSYHNRKVLGNVTYDKAEIIKHYEREYDALPHDSSWRKRLMMERIDFIKRTHGNTNSDLFLKYRTPVYFIGNNGAIFVKDAILKKTGFISVMDPYTAYQEISMFLGDRLRLRDKPMTDVKDKYKIASHGYDIKKSFRREEHPSKPRRNKKK